MSHRSIKLLAAAAVAATIGTGCGSGAGRTTSAAKAVADQASSLGRTSTPDTTGAAAPVSITLDKTVWWGVQQDRHVLFKIHFTKAELGAGSGSSATTVAGLSLPAVPTLTLSFDAENLQSDSRSLSFGHETTVTSRGRSSSPSGGNPLDLAANGTTTGAIVFQVDPSFSLDDAVLQLGGADTNASIVPFARVVPVTTFAPKSGFVTGQLVGPDHDFSFQASRLYADTTPGQKGKYVVVIEMRATFKGPDAGGGGLVSFGDFSLRSPDGSTTPGSQIVGEATDPLNAQLAVGATSPTQHVGFEIGQPVTGTYTLTYTAAQGALQGQTAQTSFSVS